MQAGPGHDLLPGRRQRRRAEEPRRSWKASAPRAIEVLLLADPIDAFWPDRLDSFEGKKLRSVTQAGEELGKDANLPDISPLLAAMKRRWGRREPTCAPPRG